MATLNVVPSAGQWRVDKQGLPISNHRKQSAAIDAARRNAESGDTITIHSTDGTIRRSVTKQ